MAPQVGQRARRSLTLTEQHVDTFAALTAEAGVVIVHASKPVTQLRVSVTRQTGEGVLEGEAWCYTLAPGAA